MPRPLIPLSAPPENRPELPRRSCPVCGSQVDPLRAGEVLLFDGGFQYLCGASCRKRYLDGERLHQNAWQPGVEDEPTAKRKLSFAHDYLAGLARDRPESGWSDPLARVRWGGVAAVCCAALAGFFSASIPAAITSAAFTALAAGAALWASWPAVKDVGWLAWALGPAGACAAAVGAAHAIVQGSGSWLGLEGAALAGAAMVARAWFDAEASAPVARAVQSLRELLPLTTRVPGKGGLGPAVSMEEVPTENVRTGEEVFALQGDKLAVDGVVQTGEALALLYPTSRTAVSRVAGDPLIAGSKIVRGAVRVLASRVGEQRALARPESFGKGAGRDAALVARVAEVVSRWGGLATIGLALSVIAVTDSGGVAAKLCAAGAVLLAAPLLAIRRAAESPLVAASAAAASRGIVYRDANALDLAGRTAVVAMSPNGTLTEGQPQVLEVHALEANMVESLVALAAGAEEAAGSDPVAVAVQEYARRHGIAPAPVRRATHLAGRGVTATAAGGESLLIGNRKLLLDEGVSVAAADAAATAAEDQGRTAIFIALANRVRAVFTLQDSLRPGARAAIQRLLDQRIEIALLTGDQRGSVEKLATDLDIAHIKAGLLPEERAKEVKLLRDAGGKVAAIGRLQVDAAVLAASDISIALDAAGSTAGEYTVMLATNDIRDAAAALWIARAARDGALGATTVAAVAFALIVAAAATGLIVPAIAATLAVAVDAYGVGAGARLLKRINLRIPV